MKKYYTLCLFFTLFTTLNSYSQTKIEGTVIEGTKLLITADAETVTKVTFTVKTTEGIKNDSLPKEFKVNPFNKHTFKSGIITLLKTLHDQGLGDDLPANAIIEEEFRNKLKHYFSDEGGVNYYRAAKKLNDKIDYLFNYFDAQLTLLFKYDTEPVAGILHYNTDIKPIQYYQNNRYETYFNNRIRSYHKLVKKLYKMRRKSVESLDSTKFNCDFIEQYLIDKDSIAAKAERKIKNNRNRIYEITGKVIGSEIEKISYDIRRKKFDSVKKVNRNQKNKQAISSENRIAIYETIDNEIEKTVDKNNVIKKVLDNMRDNQEYDYFKTITKDEAELKLEEFIWEHTDIDDNFLEKHRTYFSKNKTEADSRLKGIIKEETDSLKIQEIKRVKEKFKSDTLAKARMVKTVHYFLKNSKGHERKYTKNPSLFLTEFESIIDNFRRYNRKKRKQIITANLLKSKNKEAYDSIQQHIETYYKAEEFIDYYDKSGLFVKKVRELRNLIYDKNNKEYLYLQEDEEFQYYYEEDKEILDEEKQEIETVIDAIIKNDKIADLSDEDVSFDAKIDHFAKTSKREHDGLREKIFYYRRNKRYFDRQYGKYETNKNEIEKLKRPIKDKKTEIVILVKENSFLEKYLLSDVKTFSEFPPEQANSLIDYDYLEHKGLNGESIEIRKKDFTWKKSEARKRIFKFLKDAPLWEFKAEDIQLDINDGFVEHIVVLGEIIAPTTNNDKTEINRKIKSFVAENPDWNSNIGKKIKFVNPFPYGFSSSKDFNDFKKYKLYAYNGKHKQFEMQLDKLFPNHVENVQNDRLDFSPRDQKVRLPEGEKSKGAVELKKDKSSKLFNLIAYSDFNGLRATNPNGVIQFEVNKWVPLYTKRQASSLGERYLGRGFNFGYFNYVTPQLRWSRLDATNNEKNLTLSYLPVFEGETSAPIAYVTQLNMLRYENISVGADLNIFSFDFPMSKYRLEINAGGRYGRTRVLDTNGESVTTQNEDGENITNVDQTYEINTWRFYPEVKFRLRPEERYGAILSFRPIRFNSVTNDFYNISSEKSFTRNLEDEGQWLHQIEFQAHFSPSGRKDDRFFFRYRYTNNSRWEYNGYSEIQLGYSASLKF